jgi:hypothetical protein
MFACTGPAAKGAFGPMTSMPGRVHREIPGKALDADGIGNQRIGPMGVLNDENGNPVVGDSSDERHGSSLMGGTRKRLVPRPKFRDDPRIVDFGRAGSTQGYGRRLNR